MVDGLGALPVVGPVLDRMLPGSEAAGSGTRTHPGDLDGALHGAWAFEDFDLKDSTLLSSRADPARRSRDEEDQLGALESTDAVPQRGVRACGTFARSCAFVRRMVLARRHGRPVLLAPFR